MRPAVAPRQLRAFDFERPLVRRVQVQFDHSSLHIGDVENFVAALCQFGNSTLGRAVDYHLAGRYRQQVGCAEPLLALLVYRFAATTWEERELYSILT